MKIKQLIISFVLGLAISVAHADLVKDKDYTELSKPIPQINQNKIEVLEFFAYFCIHCKNLEPDLMEYVKQLPSDTYFRQSHVVWDDESINLARIAAAVNSSGTMFQANKEIFNVMFHEDKNQRLNLNNPTIFKEWVNTKGSWGKAVLHAYNSPNNIVEANLMKKSTIDYGITSTPQIIVGGKYQLNSHDMNKLTELINLVRQERNMPQVSSTKKYKTNISSRLHQKANR